MTAGTLIEEILRPGYLTAVFQPVFETRDGERRIHYIEALMRGPEGTNLRAAPVLFEYVRRKGQEAAVDRICVATALRAAASLCRVPAISLNIHASTLERDKGFPRFLEQTAEALSIPIAGITLEIVEHAPAFGGMAFLSVVETLRGLGALIALDDIGLGQSNYRMILESCPDYFKIDAFLVRGCHADIRRRAILESLVQLASRFGSRVIAEGVEEQGDLETISRLGIELVQGFLLSRPLAPREIDRLTGLPEEAAGSL